MRIICSRLVSINHPNGFVIGNHAHDSNEFVYCLEGNGSVTIDNKRYRFTTGDYYITAKGMVHSETDKESSRIMYFRFDAPKELVRDGVYTDYDGSVLVLLKRVQREMKLADGCSEEMAGYFIKGILTEAARSEKYSENHLDILSIQRYIDENIEQNVDFKELAAKLNYSIDRFRHIFKEHTGISPHRYLIRGRVEKAKLLLKVNPGSSLTEICYSCGFASSSHFTKVFRANVGMTPSQFAKLQKKEQ